MREIFSALVEILAESSPYLILGFALAGVIHVLLERYPRISAALTRPGKRPIFLAALLGVPMPLCSCSVLPAALALRRQGASKATTATFLVSEPETDIVSILVTFALIGPFVGLYRPVAAIAAALATGLVIYALEKREKQRRVVATAPGMSSRAHESACCDTGPMATSDVHMHARPGRRVPWWIRALRYGFVEMFDDIVPQVFLGILIAAVIGVFIPAIDPDLAREHHFLSYLIMLGVGIPVYVCAAASTPIAAGLIAAGVSPGAAMVFLLAGPATNLGSLVVLRSEFGTRILAAYVLMIAATSVALGALLDLLVGSLHVTTVAPAHPHEGTSVFAITCTLALLTWIAISFHRSRLVPRMRDRLVRRMARASR